MRVRKQYDLASFKALPDENGQTGRFQAIVSVFGNVDLQGDRVVKGAFTKSLTKWKSQGDPIPIIWSHDWADPFAHIGAADPNLAEETDIGLKLIGQMDIHKPFAAQVYDLLSQKRVREWSFAYDVEKENKAKDGANELQVLDLIEAGPTLKGANPDTVTLGVKSELEKAVMKAGRMLSAKNEGLIRQAHDLLAGVLSSLAVPDEEKAVEEWLAAEKSHHQDAQGAPAPSEGLSEAPAGPLEGLESNVAEYRQKLDRLLAEIAI